VDRVERDTEGRVEKKTSLQERGGDEGEAWMMQSIPLSVVGWLMDRR
jgi:hypothetical protein